MISNGLKSGKIFYSLVGFVVYVSIILAFTISVIHRFIVVLVLRCCYNDKYRPIKMGPPTVLAAQTHVPMNMTSVFKCKGNIKVDALIKKFYEIVNYKTKISFRGASKTVSYTPFEKLRHIIVDKFGVSCWKVDHKFEPANHITIENVDRNLDEMIQGTCEYFLDTIFDDHQPQWKMHIINKIESNECALIWSIHHSYGDGITFTQLVRYALADCPFALNELPLQKESPLRMFLRYVETFFLCTIGSPCLAPLFGRCFGKTPIKENTSTENRKRRSHCRTVTLDLNVVKSVRRQLSKNTPIRMISLQFACVAAALDRALKSSGPSTVMASTIEPYRSYESLELDTNVIPLWFDLPLKMDDNQERVFVIDQRIRNITQHFEIRFFKALMALTGAFTAPIANISFKSFGLLNHTTCMSNVAGPTETFTIFGNRVTETYAINLMNEEVVNFCAYTYCDKIIVSMVASDRVVRKLPKFLDDVVVGIGDEMQRLSKC